MRTARVTLVFDGDGWGLVRVAQGTQVVEFPCILAVYSGYRALARGVASSIG